MNVTIIAPVPGNVHIHEYGNWKYMFQDLVWDAVGSATYYEVKVGSGGNILNVGTATSHRLAMYEPGAIPPRITGYVRACNAHGCSAWDSATTH